MIKRLGIKTSNGVDAFYINPETKQVVGYYLSFYNTEYRFRGWDDSLAGMWAQEPTIKDVDCDVTLSAGRFEVDGAFNKSCIDMVFGRWLSRRIQ